MAMLFVNSFNIIFTNKEIFTAHEIFIPVLLFNTYSGTFLLITKHVQNMSFQDNPQIPPRSICRSLQKRNTFCYEINPHYFSNRIHTSVPFDSFQSERIINIYFILAVLATDSHRKYNKNKINHWILCKTVSFKNSSIPLSNRQARGMNIYGMLISLEIINQYSQ